MKQPIVMFNIKHYNEVLSHLGYDFHKKLIVVAFKNKTESKMLADGSTVTFDAGKVYTYAENVSGQSFDALMQILKDTPELIKDYAAAVLAKRNIAYIYTCKYQMQGVNASGEVLVQSNVLHDMILNLTDWSGTLRSTMNDKKDDPVTAIQSLLSDVLSQPYLKAA